MNKSENPNVSDQKTKNFQYCQLSKDLWTKFVMDGQFDECHGRTQSVNRISCVISKKFYQSVHHVWLSFMGPE